MKALISILSLTLMVSASDPTNFYDYAAVNIDGQSIDFSEYQGKVVMIVNVASKCGYTPQYEELQELYVAKKDEGLVVLGFPSNDFGQQEPGSDTEIKQFCSANYGVTFPMFSKTPVTGESIHPVYKFLTSEKLNGVMNSEVKWNFQKYLVDRNGKLRAMYKSGESVTEAEVKEMIDKLLVEK